MPVIRKINHEDRAVQEEDVLKDNDEVFYCEMSKEIFRNYEDYFDRVMFLNSTVWTCALTSRPNLTYAEALDSEAQARKILRRFPYELKAPLVFVAGRTQRCGISDLVDDVMQYVATRFFREETVTVLEKAAAKSGAPKEVWRDCEVLSVLQPDLDPLAIEDAEGGGGGAVDPAAVRYKVRIIPDDALDSPTKKRPEPFVTVGSQMRRPRSILSKDKLKLFLKQCVECNDHGMLKVKPASYEKHVTDGGVSKFTDFWVGKPPVFTASKRLLNQQKKSSLSGAASGNTSSSSSSSPANSKANNKANKKPDKDSKENKKPGKKMGRPPKQQTEADASGGKAGKKQSAGGVQPDISNYFAKNDASQPIKPAPKVNKEELLRQRKAKEAAEAAEAASKRAAAEERERQRTELLAAVAARFKSYNRIGEDLELIDQRPLPRATPVRTLLPNRLLGDALFVLEFLYSFRTVLECSDKFPKQYSLALLERSLLCPEVAGPLSDTVQVLLGTVFTLQMEEAAEVHVEYAAADSFDAIACQTSPVEAAVRDATEAQRWARQWLACALPELPMDANTVSELLRLHLLCSGAREEDECAKWRYQQRGGYRNVDDPGLALRVRSPHILRQLASRTVYQLETGDVLQVLMCLVNQILTYSSVRDVIDERLESAQRARILLRSHIAAEKRRETALQADRRNLRDTMKKTLATFEGAATAKAELAERLQAEVDTKMAALDRTAEKAREKFNEQALAYRQEIFSFQLQLGADRAHRTYWLFESLPGLFVERPSRLGRCPAVRVEQNAALAQCTSDADRLKCIKQMVMDERLGNGSSSNANGVDKENKVDNTQQKPAAKNGALKALADKPTENGVVCVDEAEDALVTELLMCTGEQEACPVHGTNASADGDDDNDWAYSFLHTERELDALIGGLNTRGQREKALKEQLETDRELILNHILDCDVPRLQVTAAEREKCVRDLYALPNYANANLGFPADMPVEEVTEGSLVDNIAELERRVTEGHLGALRVANLAEWRAALTEARDDGHSAELSWGPEGAFSRENRVGKPTESTTTSPAPSKAGSTGRQSSEKESTPAPDDKTPGALLFRDPGLNIAADAALDETTEAADAKQQRIFHIARSLLQIAQAIEQKFLQRPFGPSIKQRDPAVIRAGNEQGRAALLLWQVSLMNATSYAQIYLHYTVLEDAVMWSRSSLNAGCRVCRLRSMPEKMLLCDGCNAGRHLHCFKPKLTKVPDGEWFCEQCKPAKQADKKKKRPITRKVFSIESGNEDDLSSEEEAGADDSHLFKHFDREDSDDIRECVKCDTYSKVMLTCEVCLDRCHPYCAKPALKKVQASWMCDSCQRLGKKQMRQLKRERHMERMRRRTAAAVDVINGAAIASDSSEPDDNDDDADDAPETGTRTAAPKKAAATSRPSRKRARPAATRRVSGSDDDDDDEEEDDSQEDSQPEVMPAKKQRTAVRLAAPAASAASNSRKRKQREQPASDESDDDDDLEDTEEEDNTVDDDDGSDFEAEISKTSRSSKARRSSTHQAKKAKTEARRKVSGGISSSRRRSSTAAGGQLNGRRRTASSDEDDDDDDDDKPLLQNGRSSTGGGGRRSRRAENGGDAEQTDAAVLDTVAGYELLKLVGKHRDVWPFERPVNKHDVPDYYVVIERPMDFAKIKSNLNLGEYRSNYELMGDVQQVFENCDLYNTSGSEIYNAGVTLEKFVKARCAELNLPFKPSDMLLSELAEERKSSGNSNSNNKSAKSGRKSRS